MHYRQAFAVAGLLAGAALRVHAQDCATTTPMDHTKGHADYLAAIKACEGRASRAVPTSPGQTAFGAIAEVTRLLEADSTTDWSKVNVEALRQHLIDMDEVMMRATMTQHDVPAGITVDVNGRGRTVPAIQRLAVNQARMLDASAEYSARAVTTPAGARVAIIARAPGDARMVARIRGLGYAGLLTEGDHHARHHIALARGEANAHAH